MVTSKDESIKTKKAVEKPEKIQTAEGWKRKKEQLLKDRNVEDVKERRKAV